MLLVVWVAACILASAVFRRYPVELILASLAVWTLVPGVAGSVLVGHPNSSLAFHPATWLILTTLVTQLATDPRAIAGAIVRRFIFVVSSLLVIAAAVLETKAGQSQHGLVLAIDQMAASFFAFLVVMAGLYRDPSRGRILRNGVITLAAVEAGWAIVQYAAHSPILYKHDYEQRYWYTAGFKRWMGTTDHPLVLALLLCAAIPLLTGLHKAWVQQVLLILMLAGIVITESRAGVVAGGVGAVYVVLASRASMSRKVMGIVVLAGAALTIALSSLSNGVSDRIANDTGSAVARGTALDYFLQNWRHYFLSGGGVNSSYTVATNAGLKSSFESAFLIYSIDIGIVFAVLYFGGLLVVALRNTGRSYRGAWLSAVVVLVLCQTFSSLGVDTLVGPLLWLLVALAATTAPRDPPPEESGSAGDPVVDRLELGGPRPNVELVGHPAGPRRAEPLRQRRVGQQPG